MTGRPSETSAGCEGCTLPGGRHAVCADDGGPCDVGATNCNELPTSTLLSTPSALRPTSAGTITLTAGTTLLGYSAAACGGDVGKLTSDHASSTNPTCAPSRCYSPLLHLSITCSQGCSMYTLASSKSDTVSTAERRLVEQKRKCQ